MIGKTARVYYVQLSDKARPIRQLAAQSQNLSPIPRLSRPIYRL